MEMLEEEFLAGLVERHEALRPLMAEHLAYHEEILAHVLLADIERWAEQMVIEKPAGWEGTLSGVLDDLEAGVASGGDCVTNMILVAFVEMLPGPTDAAAELRDLLGPKLRGGLDRLEDPIA